MPNSNQVAKEGDGQSRICPAEEAQGEHSRDETDSQSHLNHACSEISLSAKVLQLGKHTQNKAYSPGNYGLARR